MAIPKEETQEKGVGATVKKIFDILAAIKLFFGDARVSLLEKADVYLRRVRYLFVVYIWISIGLVFLILGIFDFLIDHWGVPRGVIFSLGGILISLVSVIFLQTAKMKKQGK